MTKKRIINIRVCCIVFIGLMLGILFCRACCLQKLSVTAIVLVLVSLILGCGGVIVYATLTKANNLKSRARKNVSQLLTVSSIGFCIAFLIGIIILLFPFFKIMTIANINGEVTIYGTVCDYVEEGGTYTKFLIDNVIIEDEGKLTANNFKICIYSDKSSNIDLGQKVEFKCELSKYKITNELDSAYLYQNIAYNCYVNFNEIKVFDGSKSLKDIIKSSTKDILTDNLNDDNAGICYTVLFGDDTVLDTEVSDMFSYAGISHILAVSGLHIGVIVSLLYFVMKKCKLNKYLNLIILSSILLFYSYLCSFTPSVCRASIMAILLCLCNILQIEYDSLSALSIAGIIILLISPLNLFSVSFQLSFLCIFSIISIAPFIDNCLKKIKCPQFLSSALAMSIATNIAILPICLNVFVKVSLLGVISNVFILPIFSVTYVLLFIITFLSLIIKFFGGLLIVPNLFLHLIKVVANYISQIPFGIFKAFNVAYWSLVLLIGSAISLHFLLTRKIIKAGISIGLATMVLIIFLLNSIPKVYNGNNFIFVSKYNSNACYYVKDGEVSLIGASAKSYVVDRELKHLRIKNITNVIAYDLKLNCLDDFCDMCNSCNVENVYLPKTLEYAEIKNKFKNAIFFEDSIDISSLEFSAIYYKSEITAVYLNGGVFYRILIPELSPTQGEGEYISNYCQNLDVDIVYLGKDYKNLDFTKIRPDIKIVTDDNIYYKNNTTKEFDIFVYN